MVKLFTFPLSEGFATIERKASALVAEGWLFLSAAHIATSDGPGAFTVFALRDPSLMRKADGEEPAQAPEILADGEIVDPPAGNGAGNGAHDIGADS